MSKPENFFSEEEIEEIEALHDGTEAMSVNGEQIICFRILHGLVQKKIKITDVSRIELLTAYAQLKGIINTFDSWGFVDTKLLGVIVNKAKGLFLSELEKR
ncbi:hypothetical protein [Paenibacillus planticolens]|uniref:Uncharacterized protein n=1 Tax=Paenibacillus planticolens TaxID=2654976 RepID=A0ABX1ZYB3_9BACL|nr:hypothetical protein [Paenibacillus planticolens]NOV03982.1 hypothetical protein [Paenibacillus planticolens]